MAGWFGGTSALDEQIARATSSSLEDIAANLEISDLIRSKTVTARDAMRSLRRRLQHPNPNIQLATLKLTDTCVKNGGNHFLTEVASRDFIDNLTSLLRAGGGAITNQDVKDKILALIQAWAGAAGYKPEALYIGETYRSLQREGFHFPPKEDLASAVFESSAPPEWINSDVCMRCRSEFSFTNRRHHCRNCGRIFDQRCSAKTLVLPHLGIMTPVRVDDGCYEQLTKRGGGATVPLQRSASERSYSHAPGQHRYSAPMQPRDARVTDSYDDDLRKALEMSLEEVRSYSGGYVPNDPVQPPIRSSSYTQQSSRSKIRSKPIPQTPPLDEADEDLAAAIAASLKDMEQQKAKHAESMKQQKERSVESGSEFVLPNNKYELSPVEAENINLFSNLVDRLQNQPRGAILREPQIQELYETIGSMRPKLARSYGETMSKHETLLDLHSKLSTVVRYYDKMLEDRLNRTYADHNLAGYGMAGPPQQYANPISSYPPPQAQYDANPTGAENYYSTQYRSNETARGYATSDQGYSNYANPQGMPAPVQYDQYQPPNRNQNQMQTQEAPNQRQSEPLGQQYPSLPMHRAESIQAEPVSPPQPYASPHRAYPSQHADALHTPSQQSSSMESPYQQSMSADNFYHPETQLQQQPNTSGPLASRQEAQQQQQQPGPPQQQPQPQQQAPQSQMRAPVPQYSQPPVAPQQQLQSQSPEQQFYRQPAAVPNPQQYQQYAEPPVAYRESAFPAVPQHQFPQQEYRAPVKEEALIEL